MVDDWDFLDAHGAAGVGQYDAAWSTVQAEWYTAGEAIEKLENRNTASFTVRLNASSKLEFPNMKHVQLSGTLTLALNNAASGTITASIAHDDAIASCTVGRLATLISCPFSTASGGTLDAVFTFQPDHTGQSVELDWWSMASASSGESGFSDDRFSSGSRASQPTRSTATAVAARVAIGSQIATTFPQYVSVDMDWWTGENGGSGGGWADAGLLSVDLSNAQLRNLVAALGGGFLRLGGSLDTTVKYDGFGPGANDSAW